LEQSVQLHELNARRTKNLFAWHMLEYLFHHAVGAMVAIVVWIPDQCTLLIEQAIIHAPCIHADARDLAGLLRGELKARLDFIEQAKSIPMQMTGDAHGAIQKAMDRHQRQLPTRQFPDDRSSTFCAQVNRDKIPGYHFLANINLAWLSPPFSR
jgi:hypothetical protein